MNEKNDQMEKTMEPKKPKRSITIRVEEDMYSEIFQQAKELEISESYLLRHIIKKGLSENNDHAKNMTTLLMNSDIANLLLEELITNIITDPEKLAKSAEKLKSGLDIIKQKYGMN